VGAGLLAKAVCQAMMVSNVPTPSRASSLPQFFRHGWGFVVWQYKLVFEVAKDLGESSIYCGSGLARESGVSGDDGVECADAFASRLAPTVFSAWLGICGVAIQAGF
ncbi:hypothetical protein QUS05_09875, partial [Pseudomonas fluorescens]|nr:hypothetical protein [Pseudomonas fluorescens]MDP8572714.1 hypothetical protein [Pseudomonas iranensis]